MAVVIYVLAKMLSSVCSGVTACNVEKYLWPDEQYYRVT